MTTKILLLLFALALLITGFMIYQQEDHPGKKVFMDSKCTTCHTVQSQAITMKTTKKNMVDLSSVGTVYQANFIEKFLTKQEKIEDKSHPQAFKGSDEQLEQLAEWLTSLKQEKTEGTGDATKEDKKDTTKIKIH